MRVEVHLARTQSEPERFGTIARRLGVSRDSAVRWDDRWSQDVARQVVPASPRPRDLAFGRLVRLVQDRRDTPYAIGAIDEEWFVQASVGEMQHFLAGHEFRSREAALRRLAYLADRSVPMADRNAALLVFGEDLRAAFFEELKLTAGPGASRRSRSATP